MAVFVIVVVCSQRRNISKGVGCFIFDFLILKKSDRSARQPRNVCGPPWPRQCVQRSQTALVPALESSPCTQFDYHHPLPHHH